MARRRETPECPPEVLAAIPWYPDDLSQRERGEVDSHAAECLDCRRELEARMADPDEEASWPAPEPDQVFTRVLAQIEIGEAETMREWARAPRRKRAVRWLREREVHVPGLATPVSAARGLQAAASFGAVIAAAALFFGASPERQPAPVPTVVHTRELPRIDVVFREELTASAMAAALAGVNGEIVAGPTARGRYQVELPAGADPEIAAQALDDSGAVIYAEPAKGSL